MLISERVRLVVGSLFECGNLGFMIVVNEVFVCSVKTFEDEIVPASVDHILAVCTTEYEGAAFSSRSLWVRDDDVNLTSTLVSQ